MRYPNLRSSALCILLLISSLCFALDFPGTAPGPANAEISSGKIVLSNAVLQFSWDTQDGRLRFGKLMNRLSGNEIDLSGNEVFRLIPALGDAIDCSSLEVFGEAQIHTAPVNASASKLAERFPGQEVVVMLADKRKSLWVECKAVLRDGSNTVRQEFSFFTGRKDIPLKAIQLILLPASSSKVVGEVHGSPIVGGDFFFAYEYPHSQSIKYEGTNGENLVLENPISERSQNPPLRVGHPISQSCALGVAAEEQMRRSFLYYVERERAHPYRPFLHYNSWYDICWGEIKVGEKECLDVIHAFGRELSEKRGVPLSSLVIDDGWDDAKDLWRIPKDKFPDGFTNMNKAAADYNTHLGFWLSPFGGYGQPKKDRLETGKQKGFEIDEKGFVMAGPKYYQRFLETTLKLIEEYDVNFFKFDGFDSSFSETEAMVRLTGALRKKRPDVFLSITTGTWPSPFWLWYGDSTWRGGSDMNWEGSGSKREQWITYRDAQTYRGVVKKSPLYPINSLMTQGFAHARYGFASECGNNEEEIRKELRSFFASGTCLQELYVTPGMMSEANWDDLAETAQWSRDNADVLVDVHWVGGDPGEGMVYGWAAWSKTKAMLALRNPTDQPAQIALDAGKVFEIPKGASKQYRLKSPWKSDAGQSAFEITAGKEHTFALRPFEVVVYDATPID